MRGERGQASVEWIGAVLLVVVVFVAAAAGALPGADAVPRAVGATFARAFCLVSGGDCLSGAPRPCVVRSEERSRERELDVLVLRLGDGRTVLREELSDGTVAVTVLDEVGGGVVLSVGGGLSPLGAAVAATAEAQVGRGERYLVADGAAADRLVARIAEDDGGLPAPDERWRSLEHGSSAEVELAAVAGVEGELSSRYVLGERSRPSTGERTLVLRHDAEVGALLLARVVEAGLAAPAETSLELTLDRSGDPVALTARAVRGVEGEVELGSARATDGQLVEVAARLDLADPVARGLVAEVLDALTSPSPGAALEPARALGERLASRARVDVRVYETGRRTRREGGALAHLARGVYEARRVTRTARLVDAAGREPGMGWVRRMDCVGVA